MANIRRIVPAGSHQPLGPDDPEAMVFGPPPAGPEDGAAPAQPRMPATVFPARSLPPSTSAALQAVDAARQALDRALADLAAAVRAETDGLERIESLRRSVEALMDERRRPSEPPAAQP